jgi:hypothetical protein
MESLYTIKLNLSEEYLSLIDKFLKILFSYFFLIILENNKKVTPMLFLIYNLIGNFFYELVFKRLIKFK